MESNTMVVLFIMFQLFGTFLCGPLQNKGEVSSIEEEYKEKSVQKRRDPTTQDCINMGCSLRITSSTVYCAQCGGPTLNPNPSTQYCLDIGCQLRIYNGIQYWCANCGPTLQQCKQEGCYDRISHDGGINYQCSDCGNPPITTPAPSGGCFPSPAKVNCKDRRTVTMSELQVGDHIQIVASDGTLTYSKVTSFVKNQQTLTTMYKSITTSFNNTITLTMDHLIYTRKDRADKFIPIHADMVSNGDEVLVQRNDELTPEKIIKVSTLTMQGAYVPLTIEGNIIVDRVLASCYASSDHDVAHTVMSPIQWFPWITEWVFGQNKGFLISVHILEDLGRWLLPTVN